MVGIEIPQAPLQGSGHTEYSPAIACNIEVNLSMRLGHVFPGLHVVDKLLYQLNRRLRESPLLPEVVTEETLKLGDNEHVGRHFARQ